MRTVFSAIYPSDAHLCTLPDNKYFATIFDPKDFWDEDGILLLHGGSDIHPSLYGQQPNKYVQTGYLGPSPRDQVEVALVKSAIERKMPIFGICRGAQLLCAMAGGTLVQHVEGHHHEHRIRDKENNVLKTSSSHHQMMNPTGTEHELIAWTNKPLSQKYLGEEEKPVHMEVEPEIVFFPQIKALAVQGHPEWMSRKEAFVKYCLNLIQEKLQ